MITQRILHALIVACVATLTMHGMNEKNLQNNEPITIDAFVSIIKHPIKQVAYTYQKIHNELAEYYNIHSTTLKDPILFVKVSEKNSTFSQVILLPAKDFIHCTDGSLIQFYALHKGIPILTNATCRKNSKISNKSFREQYNIYIDNFFQKPNIACATTEQVKELEDAGIITSKTVYIAVGVIDELTEQPVLLGYDTRIKHSHGPNSYKDKKDVEKSILREKIPHNLKILNALAKRERNGSFK